MSHNTVKTHFFKPHTSDFACGTKGKSKDYNLGGVCYKRDRDEITCKACKAWVMRHWKEFSDRRERF